METKMKISLAVALGAFILAILTVIGIIEQTIGIPCVLALLALVNIINGFIYLNKGDKKRARSSLAVGVFVLLSMFYYLYMLIEK